MAGLRPRPSFPSEPKTQAEGDDKMSEVARKRVKPQPQRMAQSFDGDLKAAKRDKKTVTVVLPIEITGLTDATGAFIAEVEWVDTYAVKFQKDDEYFWISKAFLTVVFL
jgi:hypothetical protein